MLSFHLVGQSKNPSFSALSSPEKWWVIWHPFKAKRALEVSLRTLAITDSIKATGCLDTDISGGRLDAFKHCFWMASLSTHIGKKAGLRLGRAHEKGNYRSFLNGNLEDGYLPDKASSTMDLFNNEAGAQMFTNHPGSTEIEFIRLTLQKIQKGELRILKKDGNVFLNCQGKPISEASLQGRWENDKCLVPSNEP